MVSLDAHTCEIRFNYAWMDYYKERLSAFTYVIGELTQTYTSTYIRKEGNDLGEQSPKDHNPPESEQWVRFQRKGYPLYPFFLPAWKS